MKLNNEYLRFGDSLLQVMKLLLYLWILLETGH